MPNNESRKLFTDEVTDRFRRAVEELCRDVPEFKGAIISPVWDTSTASTRFGLILGQDVASMPFLLQGCSQTLQTLQTMLESITEQLRIAEDAAKDLDELLQHKQAELNSLNSAIKQKLE